MPAWPASRRLAPAALALLPGGLVVACALVSALQGYRVNFTGSLPIGVWRQVPAGDAQYVSFCLPDLALARAVRERDYVAHGACPGQLLPLLKPIAARPDDEVVVGVDGIQVNGKAVVRGPVPETDRGGRRISPYPVGRYPVEVHALWVISTHHTRSLDSRYFGPIDDRTVIAYMAPVWVWSAQAEETGRGQ